MRGKPELHERMKRLSKAIRKSPVDKEHKCPDFYELAKISPLPEVTFGRSSGGALSVVGSNDSVDRPAMQSEAEQIVQAVQSMNQQLPQAVASAVSPSAMPALPILLSQAAAAFSQQPPQFYRQNTNLTAASHLSAMLNALAATNATSIGSGNGVATTVANTAFPMFGNDNLNVEQLMMLMKNGGDNTGQVQPQQQSLASMPSLQQASFAAPAPSTNNGAAAALELKLDLQQASLLIKLLRQQNIQEHQLQAMMMQILGMSSSNNGTTGVAPVPSAAGSICSQKTQVTDHMQSPIMEQLKPPAFQKPHLQHQQQFAPQGCLQQLSNIASLIADSNNSNQSKPNATSNDNYNLQSLFSGMTAQQAQQALTILQGNLPVQAKNNFLMDLAKQQEQQLKKRQALENAQRQHRQQMMVAAGQQQQEQQQQQERLSSQAPPINQNDAIAQLLSMQGGGKQQQQSLPERPNQGSNNNASINLLLQSLVQNQGASAPSIGANKSASDVNPQSQSDLIIQLIGSLDNTSKVGANQHQVANNQAQQQEQAQKQSQVASASTSKMNEILQQLATNLNALNGVQQQLAANATSNSNQMEQMYQNSNGSLFGMPFGKSGR